MNIPKQICLGHINNLREHPEAELIALTTPERIFGDYKVTKFKSRKALEAFCKDGSKLHALVKTPTHRNMLVNRNTQVAE